MIMSNSISEILAPTFDEIEKEYFSGAVQWADDILDGAWSKACLKLEDQINYAQSKPDLYFQIMREAAKEYKHTLLGLIARYKQSKNSEHINAFFDELTGIYHDKI